MRKVGRTQRDSRPTSKEAEVIKELRRWESELPGGDEN